MQNEGEGDDSENLFQGFDVHTDQKLAPRSLGGPSRRTIQQTYSVVRSNLSLAHLTAAMIRAILEHAQVCAAILSDSARFMSHPQHRDYERLYAARSYVVVSVT